MCYPSRTILWQELWQWPDSLKERYISLVSRGSFNRRRSVSYCNRVKKGGARSSDWLEVYKRTTDPNESPESHKWNSNQRRNMRLRCLDDKEMLIGARSSNWEALKGIRLGNSIWAKLKVRFNLSCSYCWDLLSRRDHHNKNRLSCIDGKG